ncbi:MAG TPA: M28 family metallopeptidase, partial [Longimicrobiales bacterium]|nr:M28 family metallopeptidase [Longimicrobiales bacterium]
MAHLGRVARQAHPIGSPQHDGVRGLLVERLGSMGLDPEIQTETVAMRDSGVVRAATVRNVVARIPGSATTGAVALVAHYDGAPLSPGASDDALGVAAVLETARAVTAGGQLRNDLVVVFTDGGELGGLGARAFVADHPWAGDVAVALAVEARSGAGPAMAVEGPSGVGSFVSWSGGWGPGTTSLGRALLGGSGPHDELVPFLDTGTEGLRLSTVGAPTLRHQPADVPADVSEATLQDVGRQLLAL